MPKPTPTKVMRSPPATRSSGSATVSPQVGASDTGESSTEYLTRMYDKRLAAMMAEFKKQMHAMQNLFVTNNQQLQTSVQELQNELQKVQESTATFLQQSERDHAPHGTAEPPEELQPGPTIHAERFEGAAISEPLQPLPGSQAPLGIWSQPSSAITSDNRQFRHKKIYPLPTFSGLPEEWQVFVEAFESTTRDFEYSNLHNIMRLRDALKDRAKETVEALLANSNNVATIMETLQATYGRPEQLIKSQIKKVRMIPTIADDSLESLVNFATQMNNMATFLKNAKGEHHLSNPTLLSELVGKLPVQKQMQWAEKCLQLDRHPTIVDFSDWLNTVRRLAHMVADSLSITSNPFKEKKTPKFSGSNAARRFVAVGVAHRKCLQCDGECSQLKECRSFLQLSVGDRCDRAKEMRVCYCCLKRGHHARNCYGRKRCGADGCTQAHHPLLHISQSIAPNASEEQQGRVQNSQRSCHTDDRISQHVLFQILPVKLYANGIVKSTYAFCDDGANVSIIDRGLAKDLGLRGKRETLELQWLNDVKKSEQSEVVDITISGADLNAVKYKMSKVYVSSHLSLPQQSFNRSAVLSSQHLSKFPIRDYNEVQPKIVISLNHAFLTVPVEIPRSLGDSGPIAVRTRLGWLVYGPLNTKEDRSVKRVLHCRRSIAYDDEKLNEMHMMMKQYFELETFGVKADLKPLTSSDDERAMLILKSTTKRIGNRYESGLIWKENVQPFPPSFDMAVRRLESVERKMKKDPEYGKEYCKKIDYYVKSGYARKLEPEEAALRHERTFYLPHFGVRNPNKTGIRLVFDASAEVKNFSLNKALMSGPDLNQPLISILFKFRQAPVAVCGDIKDMFHQIIVRQADRDCQRFLWRNGESSNPIETYAMERLIFGATCSPTVAQFVKNCNASRFWKTSTRAVKGIVEKHYVDDYVDCFQSEKEAIDVIKEVISIHMQGGFELRNIVSNSNAVMEAVGRSASENRDFVSVEGKIERILGMRWLPKPDVFVFALKFNKVPGDILDFSRKPSKRETLAVNMSVFDPFGFLANYMIMAKILMQNIWKSSIDWDDPITDEIYRRWKLWLTELKRVEQIRIERCYFANFERASVELHIFADASEQALAVVAYWRVVDGGKVKVRFVAAKTSCAPTRFHTIPKMELQAAVMGVRLKESIIKCHEVNVNRCVFWSDSHTVIRWVNSDHRSYKQYVANRVAEILEYSEINDWRWCPGSLNPADEATRAKIPPTRNSKWISGPDFLHNDEEEWPDNSDMQSSEDRSSEEIRANYAAFATHQVCLLTTRINRFSNFRRLKRTIAWVWRFVKNLNRKRQHEDLRIGELSVEEEADAEVYLLKCVQEEVFSADLENLRRKAAIAATSPLKSLNPYIGENGLIRAHGRVERAKCLPEETRRPVILPKLHQLTRLIAQYYHNKGYHINVSTTMCEIRQRFWIPSLRRLLNSIQAKCPVCRIRRVTPRQPQMSALPPDRVTPYVRPFSYTGLDFFGPTFVTIRRQREKRWVALFTCLTTRAVHLETAVDLSTDSCLMVIRNFLNRRGIPVQMRSDNGTNFVGIAKELEKSGSELAPAGIKWVFTTPANPSEGGVWERLVRSVKQALRMMLKEQAPRLETLQSFLIEAENIVNSRPLTHLPVTPEDPEPLTPNHFLLGCTNSTQTPAPYEPKLMCLRKQWRVVQNLRNGMWRRWVQEYLPDLTRRTKWCLPSKPISIGDLVFICDVDLPRSQWKRGRVLRLFHGSDGIARSAEVRTADSCYRRPVSKLAILDLDVQKED